MIDSCTIAMPACSVPSCRNNYIDRHSKRPLYLDTKIVSSFSLPDRVKYPSNFKRWKKQVRRNWEEEKLTDNQIQKLYVCEVHFEPYLIKHNKERKTLADRKNVVPTRKLGAGHDFKGAVSDEWLAYQLEELEPPKEEEQHVHTPPHSRAVIRQLASASRPHTGLTCSPSLRTLLEMVEMNICWMLRTLSRTRPDVSGIDADLSSSAAKKLPPPKKHTHAHNAHIYAHTNTHGHS